MKKIRIALSSAVAWLVVLLFLFPIYWLISSSVKQAPDIFAMPPKLFVFKVVFQNYISIFSMTHIGSYIVNSLIICSCTVFLSMTLGTSAAYALSRFEFKRKKDISFWIISIRMSPPIFAIVPIFIIVNKIGLYDNYLSLILLYLMFNIPFAVWMMRAYISLIPSELDDAAKVEGCGPLRVLLTVIIPLAKTGLITTTIMNFIFSWNEFFFAFLLTGQRAKTVPVAIAGYITQTGIRWGELTAAGTVILAPILILSLFVSRQFIKGLMEGAVKF